MELEPIAAALVVCSGLITGAIWLFKGYGGLKFMDSILFTIGISVTLFGILILAGIEFTAIHVILVSVVFIIAMILLKVSPVRNAIAGFFRGTWP